MPRKPSTSGIKMTRKNAPGRVAKVRDIAGPSEQRCEHREAIKAKTGDLVVKRGKVATIRCEHRATTHRKFQWVCDKHDPGNKPGAGCQHQTTSIYLGAKTCSYCGYVLEGE